MSESAQMGARVDRVVSRLHAFQDRVLAARWVQASDELGRRLELDPACVCVRGYDHDGAHSVIELWNDARRTERQSQH